MKELVSLAWSVCICNKMSFLWDFYGIPFPFFKSDFYCKECVVCVIVQMLLQFFSINALNLIFWSMNEIFKPSPRIISKADLETKPALLYPFIPMRLRIQHSTIILRFYMEPRWFSSFINRGFSSFLFFRYRKTERWSERTINLLNLLSIMMLSGKTIA